MSRRDRLLSEHIEGKTMRNNKEHLGSIRRLFLGRLVTTVAIGAIFCGGCVHTTPTISFDEFMALQREAAPPESQPAPAGPQAGKTRIDRNLGPYRAGSGDVLMVTLSGLDVAVVSPVSALVHSDGAITLPLAGDITVEGQTLEEIATRLKALKVKPADYVTLVIQGSFPIESDIWHDWWRCFRETLRSGKVRQGKKGKEKM